MGLDPQTAVGPQLSLRPETMRGLDQGDHQSGSNGADRRNLAQQLGGAMFAALLEKISPYLLMQNPQEVQFLIEEQCRPGKTWLLRAKLLISVVLPAAETGNDLNSI